jgi:hypothetical protein
MDEKYKWEYASYVKNKALVETRNAVRLAESGL